MTVPATSIERAARELEYWQRCLDEHREKLSVAKADLRGRGDCRAEEIAVRKRAIAGHEEDVRTVLAAAADAEKKLADAKLASLPAVERLRIRTEELKSLVAIARAPAEGDDEMGNALMKQLLGGEYARLRSEGRSHDDAMALLKAERTRARLRETAVELEKLADTAEARPRASTSPELIRSRASGVDGETDRSFFIGEVALQKGPQRQADLLLAKVGIANAERALHEAHARGVEREEELELHARVQHARAAYDAVSGARPVAKYHEAQPDAPLRPRTVDVGGVSVLQGGGGYVDRLTTLARIASAEVKLGQLQNIAERLRNVVGDANASRSAMGQAEAEQRRAAEDRAKAAEADYEAQRDLVAALRESLAAP